MPKSWIGIAALWLLSCSTPRLGVCLEGKAFIGRRKLEMGRLRGPDETDCEYKAGIDG